MRVVVGIITDNKEILLLKRIIQIGKRFIQWNWWKS